MSIEKFCVPQIVNCICLRFNSTTKKGVNIGIPYKDIEIIVVNRRDLKVDVNIAKDNFNNEDYDKINLENNSRTLEVDISDPASNCVTFLIQMLVLLLHFVK